MPTELMAATRRALAVCKRVEVTKEFEEHGYLEKVSRKKDVRLLDFVQMRGGRALPKFLSPFHKCIFGQLKESISS